MSETTGPTVLRMILGRQLRALREKAGLGYDEAAEAILVSAPTIRRMEGTEGGFKLVTVKAALQAYGITDDAEIRAFLTLARKATAPGWWHSYNDVLPGSFTTAVGLEEAAALIRSYDPQAVPGLLQTQEYARAIVRTGFPDAPGEEIERRAGLRLARQQVLDRPSPPALWAVIDEAALRRAAAASPEVMRGQVDRLAQAARRPGITVQLLPYAAGLHPAMYGPFRLFRFEADQPDIVACESLTGVTYLAKPDETALYVQALDRVSAQAAPPADTLAILAAIRKET